jgi:hypothetical protein
MNDRSNKLVGEVISRTTMGVVGLALLFGGFKCLSTARALWKEYEQTSSYQRPDISPNSNSGAEVPALIGAVLVLLGGFLAFAAVVPVAVVARSVRPPRATLFDGAEADQAQSIGSIFRLFRRW